MANLLSSSNFVFLNDGSDTRISANPDHNSVPDLTFCSYWVSVRCTWQISEDALGSDHVPIIIDLLLDSVGTGELILHIPFDLRF